MTGRIIICCKDGSIRQEELSDEELLTGLGKAHESYKYIGAKWDYTHPYGTSINYYFKEGETNEH